MAFTLAAVILLSPDHQKALKVFGVLCSRIEAAGVLPFRFFIASVLLFVSPGFCLFPRESCLPEVCLSCSELQLWGVFQSPQLARERSRLRVDQQKH